MKNFILSLGLLLLFGNVFGQGVPNHDFESWQKKLHFEDPTGFFTTNQMLFMQGLNPNVTKSSDAISGSFSLKLETKIVGQDTQFAFALNSMPNDQGIAGGTPYSEKPDSIKFYYKSQLSGNDSALLVVIFKKTGFPVAFAVYPFGGTNSAWTPAAFKLPFLMLNPDTLIYGFASTNPDAYSGIPGNWVMVDKVMVTGATTQFPNNDFENWSSYETTEPTGWNSFNVLLQMEGKAPNVTKSTDAHSGNYSLSLKTSALSNFGGLDTFGMVSTGMIDNNGFSGGFPMKNKPDSIAFYYKYNNSSYPMDAAMILVLFSKFNTTLQKSETVDSVISFLTSSFSWKRMSFKFKASATPDTANIFFSSSNLLFNVKGFGNELLVDDLLFYYGSVGISVSNFEGSGTVYPNPAVDYFNIDFVLDNDQTKQVNLSIYSNSGQLVMSTSKNELVKGKNIIKADVSNLPVGNYHFRLDDGGTNYYSGTFNVVR